MVTVPTYVCMGEGAQESAWVGQVGRQAEGARTAKAAVRYRYVPQSSCPLDPKQNRNLDPQTHHEVADPDLLDRALGELTVASKGMGIRDVQPLRPHNVAQRGAA